MNLNNLKKAVSFLTIIPFFKRYDSSVKELGKTTALFPLVGLFIALILVVENFILLKVLPSSIVNVVLLLTLLVITRGLHIDGFSDMIDGFYGAYDAKGRLKIMKDSKIGVFAVCGIFFLLLLKFISLNNLSPDMSYSALFVMPIAGRFSIVFICFMSTYIEGSAGIGKTFVENTGEREFWFALLSSIFLVFLFMVGKGVLILCGIIVFSTLFEGYAKKRIGGVNGDILGASCEISEVLVLILANIFDNSLSRHVPFDGIWL